MLHLSKGNYNGGISLGELIRQLEACKPELDVYFDVLNLRPTTLASYRGYYECLALGFSIGEVADGPTNVSALLSKLKAAVGKTYEGWKGGEFMMTNKTEMYVANSGETSERVIVGVRVTWAVIIVTRDFEAE